MPRPKRPKAPALPAWVRAACVQRFPTDPARRMACIAALGRFTR
ncbi:MULTISPECIES: hypothetical protein [Actinomadura]|uniref:Uncharacterized protein n=1 Tax=Actinomadura yumaensis TaxID=111807 RepID=A0ABW2CB73_9ACTN|nr:hypothetical protein [Actinomadura sp. J1-007]